MTDDEISYTTYYLAIARMIHQMLDSLEDVTPFSEGTIGTFALTALTEGYIHNQSEEEFREEIDQVIVLAKKMLAARKKEEAEADDQGYEA